MNQLLRILYRVAIRMHPVAFRAEFGDEMLWIFDQQLRDEESPNGAAARLLFDGVRSIVIQNAKPRIHQTETVVPYYREIDSSIPAFRFTQAGLIIVSCIFCIFSLSLFLSMVVPKVTVPDRDWLFTRIKIFSFVPTPGPQGNGH
jgi:hypothetical protein